MEKIASLLPLPALLQAVSGTVLAARQENEGSFASVVTDSRQVEPGSLFVPLIGTVQDGHAFIPAALEKGASVVLVSNAAMFSYEELAKKYACTFVLVKNTLLALQQAAAAYLDLFPRLIKIGITGSSGKTTTKEILGSILSQRHRVVMNEGNLNSETGLPLSVFKVRAHHEIGIFEAGMNRLHEIGELAAVLRPHIAVITNIGTAHIGILGSRDAIAAEKRTLFSHFTARDRGFVYENDDYKTFLMSDTKGTVATFGAETTRGIDRIESAGLGGSVLVFKKDDGTELRANLPLPGQYNALNACAAVSAALELGEDFETICRGINQVTPIFGRSQTIVSGGMTFVMDCYNANPDSMENALDFCRSLTWPGRKVYVIGSMLELGKEEEAEHIKVGKQLAVSGADMLFLFGREMRAAADVAAAAGVPFFHTCSMAELSAHLCSFCRNGDFIFIKGSRGCALETAVRPLLQKEPLTEAEH